jgi:transposase
LYPERQAASVFPFSGERGMRYSDAFKSKMVRKMTGSDGLSANALSEDVGISQPTLSRWLRESTSGMVSTMSRSKTKKHKRPSDWTPGEKIVIVAAALGLSGEDLGTFLRREGLHQAQLETWRKILAEALGKKDSGRTKASPEKRRVRELEKELRRKDKALAETAALLVLKKKAQAIWGDEDDDPGPRSGR